MEKYFSAGNEKHVESSSFFDIKSGKKIGETSSRRCSKKMKKWRKNDGKGIVMLKRG